MKLHDEVFAPVLAELDNWRATGRQARLWLRDDDAAEWTPALERLVSTTASFDVQLLLCVVPQATSETLSERLRAQSHVRISVHGIGHHNHAPVGEKAQELGPHRPVQVTVGELRAARSKLERLYGTQLSTILVPPWNRISPDVVKRLPDLGFTGLSTFGTAYEADGVDGVCQLNTHLDIIDWKGSRGGRDPKWLAAELQRLLLRSRETGEAPIGILGHHLDHDELAWHFIEQLFAATHHHPAVRWCVADDLIA